MTDRIEEIRAIMNSVKTTETKMEKERQCYTCANGKQDESGFYCEKAADDYDCEDDGCSNYISGALSYSKIAEDELAMLFEDIPYLLDRLAEAEAEVERLREAQRWVPVSEGLPKEQHYPPVICGHDKDVWTDAAIVTGRGKWINSEGCEIYPTHWMPLPEPPEEGEGK